MTSDSTSTRSTVVFGRGDLSAGPIEFRRGWVLDASESTHPAASTWIRVPLGARVLYVHPAFDWLRVSAGDWTVSLVGSPIDLRLGTRDPENIAKSIARRLGIEDLSARLLEYIAYLGGRFVCIVHNSTNSRYWVIPDAVASIPVFWGRTAENHVVLASHSKMVAERVETTASAAARSFLSTAREMRTRGTIFLPGINTHWAGVKPLIPNHLLLIDGSDVTHSRFYPFERDSFPVRPEDSLEVFSALFERQVAAICSIGPPGISLTGGRDSQATLAAALPYLGTGALTWTFHNAATRHEGMESDLRAARSLAHRFGLEHITVPISDSNDPEFGAGFAKTMGHGAQFRRLPESYNDHLPANIVELNSMVAETGTGFYKNRDGDATPDRLAQLYSRSEFGAQPEVIEALDEFIDYADFKADRFGDVDFHDLFYWEHRIGRWGTQRMQEVDLSHQMMLPFNSRGIIEALMAPKIEVRREKTVLSEYIEANLIG